MKASKNNPSNKVRIFLKGLSASTSKPIPQFAEPDKKDYGKPKKELSPFLKEARMSSLSWGQAKSMKRGEL